jgi:hypothetical protein
VDRLLDTPIEGCRNRSRESGTGQIILQHNPFCAPPALSGTAFKWGFTQMGRFAAQYRARFGGYPSETVMRAR